MVPWPEIMTTAVSGRTRFISARVSSPSMPGIQMSRKMTSGVSSCSRAIASSPEPTAVTRYPSSSRTPLKVVRIARSSSTIRMCSPGIAAPASGLHRRGHRPPGGQLDDEAATVRRVVLDPDGPAVIGDDLVDDRQAEPHAGGLGGEVGHEEALAVLG